MDIRTARPSDAPLVLSLALADDAQIVRDPDWPPRSSPLRPLMHAVVPVALRGHVWVGRNGRESGLLEVRPRAVVPACDISRLAARGGDSLLPALIDAATLYAQHHGLPRLFARTDESGHERLLRLGFGVLAREYTLIGPANGLSGGVELPLDVRYKLVEDAWPLHQLESDVTPPLIRQLAGFTSQEWSRRTRGLTQMVVERENRIVAWIGWQARGSRHLSPIGLLVHPHHSEVAAPLLEHVLQSLGGRQAMARVPDYQAGALQALSDAGFHISGEDVLMIKHAQVAEVRARRSLRQAARIGAVGAFRQPVARPVGPPVHVILGDGSTSSPTAQPTCR